MSSEENEFLIPFGESRKGREPELEEKALGRRLASYVSGRLVDRPNIGRRTNGRDRRDIDIPTGGKPGKRKPTGSRRDPDNDGWADEGSTNPIWVGVDGDDQKPRLTSGSRPTDERSRSSREGRYDDLETAFEAVSPGDSKLSSGGYKAGRPLVEDDWKPGQKPFDKNLEMISADPIAREVWEDRKGRDVILEADKWGNVIAYSRITRRPIGYALLDRGHTFIKNEGLKPHPRASRHYIHMIHVKESWRGHGVASMMLDFAESIYGGRVEHSPALTEDGKRFAERDAAESGRPLVGSLSSGSVSAFVSERQRKKIQKKNKKAYSEQMSSDQKRAYDSYFGPLYARMNQLLNGTAVPGDQAINPYGMTDAEIRKIATEFAKTFNEFSEYLDRDIIVWRGVSIDEQLFNKIVADGAMRVNGFISTSTQRGVAVDFAVNPWLTERRRVNGVRVLFRLKAPKGLPALTNENNDIEAELLFRPEFGTISIDSVSDETITDGLGEQFNFKVIEGSLSSGLSADGASGDAVETFTFDESFGNRSKSGNASRNVLNNSAATPTTAISITDEEREKFSSGIASTLMNVWNEWNAADPDNLQLTRDILDNALMIAGAEAISVQDAIAKVIKRLVGKDKRNDGDVAVPRPLNGLLYTIRNFHEFYGLQRRDRRTLDSEGQSVPLGVGSEDLAFSSGANFNAEVERRKLDPQRELQAEDIRRELELRVIRGINWQSGPRPPGSTSTETVDISDFVNDYENEMLVALINDLFGGLDIDDDKDRVEIALDRDLTYVDRDSGDTVNLGNTISLSLQYGEMEVERAPSQAQLIKEIDNGGDISEYGDAIHFNLHVSFRAPDRIVNRLIDEGYDPPSIGYMEFTFQINNTGSSVYLNKMQIDPKFKNSGVARAVMADSENVWRAMGANAIYLLGRSSVSQRQANKIKNGENVPLNEIEYTGASYWGVNGFDWHGDYARDAMVGLVLVQMKKENSGTAERNYFSQSERERVLSTLTEEDGFIYSSIKTPEELMSLAGKESITRYLAEWGMDLGYGVEIRYRRIINPEEHKKSQDLRIGLALGELDQNIVDAWLSSPTNSRVAGQNLRVPFYVSALINGTRGDNGITYLRNLSRENADKFSSGVSTSIEIERHGRERPFDIPVGFTVGDKKFTFSHGGDSPGRSMYNGYIAAFADNGELAGYIDYNSESVRNTAVVAMIEVNEKFKRMGIGTALLDALRISMPEHEISPGYKTEDGDNWWKAATGGPGPVKGPRRGASIKIDDKRPGVDTIGSLSSGLSDNPASINDKYHGIHRAPDRNNGAPMHDMTDGVYPEDLYSVNGGTYYGLGDSRAEEVMAILRRVRNKPDAMVTVYRAVPLSPDERLDELEKQKEYILRSGKIPKYVDGSDLEDVSEYYDAISREIEMLRNSKHRGTKTSINAGDWVTPVKSYAREHGNSNLGGRGNYRVVQKRVQARHLFTEGNSLLEFGYDPDDNPNRLSSGENEPPTFPREPSYGPYLGDAETIFGDSRTWSELRDAVRGRDIIFVDYETTGLVTDDFREVHGNGKPVQIALIKMRDGRVIDELNVFMNPGEPLGDWSSKNLFRTDGEQLTDEWLAGQMSIADAHKLVADFAGPNSIFGVQNARFDKNVLEDALSEAGIDWRPSGYIDTMDVAQMVLPKYSEASPDGPFIEKNGEKIPSSSLKAITKYLGVALEKHHSAEHDALAAGLALFAMIGQAEDRGWDSRILDRAKRLDFLDKRTARFEQSRRDFEDKKRQFLESQSGNNGSFSSGGTSRPIIPIPGRQGAADQQQTRAQRPTIQVQVMDRETKERLQRHQGRNYKYGDTSELGQPITMNADRPLFGLTSKQIANVIVPDSEDTYFKMLADSYTPIGMPVSDMDRALRLASLRGEYERQKIKFGVNIDFSPEAVNQMRRIVAASLDAMPALKWGMENFGAPPIVQFATSLNSISERTAAIYAVEINTIGVTPRYMSAINSTGDFAGRPPLPMSMKSPDLNQHTISYSVSGIIAHEWGHYIHYSLMAHAQSPYNNYYKVDDVGPFLGGLQHGLGDASSPLRMRAMQVAEEYFNETWKVEYDESVRPFRRISPETPKERFDREYALHQNSGEAFGDSWKKDPQPLVRGRYGSSEPLEAIAEASAAILHPDPQFKEIAINDKLRMDFFALLGLDDRATPWDDMLERDRVLSAGSIGTSLRNAHRERIDLARRDIRDQSERSLSSGRGMQSRIYSDDSLTDSQKLTLIRSPKGRRKTGVISSIEMEMFGPSRREIAVRDRGAFSSGARAQTLYPGIYKKPSSLTVISDEYTERINGGRAEALAEVHVIGEEQVIFGRFPEDIQQALKVDNAKIVPINPYEISGYSPESEDGQAVAIQWAMARAAYAEETGNQTSTYVDALLYAAVRGDSEAQNTFDELAQTGTQLVENAKRKALAEDLRRGSESTREGGRRAAEYAQIADYGTGELFLVHETAWGINRDDEGNILLRPSGDYGPMVGEDGTVQEHYRQTLHFALNHLVAGHMLRERKSKSQIIVTPLKTFIEDNPGALENLMTIDTWAVPRPREPLILRGAHIIENDGSGKNLDAELDKFLRENGSSTFDGTVMQPGESFVVEKIAQELGVTSRAHWTSASRSMENSTTSKETAEVPTLVNVLAELSENHIARFPDTPSRFTSYRARSTEESLASGAMRRIDEITGRTFGGFAAYSGVEPRLRRKPRRSGISQRERESFKRRNERLSSGSDSTPRIGTVSAEPVSTVRAKRFDVSDYGQGSEYTIEYPEQETDVPVYDINGEQVVFGTERVDTPGIKRLPVNPYAITNTSSTSEEGRAYARKWFMATVAHVNELRSAGRLTGSNDGLGGLPCALLYAAARGDIGAEKELNRLADIGEASIREGRDLWRKGVYRRYGRGGDRTGRDRTPEWWAQNYPGYIDVVIPDKDAPWESDKTTRRILGMEDLFAVHQTAHKPTIDEDGNLILRPLSDYDFINPNTGKPLTSPFTGGPTRKYRDTVHFALNHLVTGHIFRQPPTTTNYAVIIPLSKLMEANPGATDNIYSVDTYMTPKPGEGLIFPKGTYRLITLPGVSDHTGVSEPTLSYAERTREEHDVWGRAVSETNSHRENIVEDELKKMGQEVHGNPHYKTPIFRGGDNGADDHIDVRIFDIAHALGIRSGMHTESPNDSLEKRGEFDQSSYVASMAYYDFHNFSIQEGQDPTFPIRELYHLSDNAILRVADNDRFRTSKDYFKPRRDSDMFLADDDDGEFESGGQTVMPGTFDAATARSMIINTDQRPEKIEIDPSWIRDGFEIGWLRQKFPNMHFAQSDLPFQRGMYIPVTGELRKDASSYDKWNDSQLLSGYLRRNYWHPGIVDPESELGAVMQLWRSDFAESRAITRALSGMDVPEAFAERGALFERDVQAMRTGLASAPELGFETYRFARLTPDVGSSARVGDELTFNAAAVAVGVNSAAEYDVDELSMANMPGKYIFEFPSNTRGLLFDEQGLAAINKPNAKGGDKGPVEGIVSGRFRVASIKQVSVRNPYSRKESKRDVLVLERLSSGESAQTPDSKQRFIVTNDDGQVLFSPGRHQVGVIRDLLGGGKSISTGDLIRETTVDATLMPAKPSSVQNGYLTGARAKNFVTENIARSLDISALEIVDLFADNGEDTPSGLKIKPLLPLEGQFANDFAQGAKKLPFVPDGENFVSAWMVRDNVRSGGAGEFLLFDGKLGGRSKMISAAGESQLDDSTIEQMKSLTLEKRMAIHEQFVQPIIDRGLGTLVRDLMSDPENMPPEAPDDRRFLIKPLGIRFNNEEIRASNAPELGYKVGGTLFLALGGRLDENGNIPREHMPLVGQISTFYREHRGIAELLATYVERAMMEMEIQNWTGAPNIDSRRPINRDDLSDALSRIGPNGELPNLIAENLQFEIDGEIPLKTGSQDSWTVKPFHGRNSPSAKRFAPDDEFRREYFGAQLIDKNHPQFDAILKQAITSDIVHTWAISSNDANPVGLAIQNMARRIFGADKAVGWQLEFPLSGLGGPISTAISTDLLSGSALDAAIEDKMNNASRAFDAAPELSEQQEQFFAKVLRAMHASTQEYYKSKGITHIPVYRGVALTPEQAGYNVSEDKEAATPGFAMWTEEVAMRPLSSWTTNYEIARSFSETGLGVSSKPLPHMLFSLVPVDQVLCNPFTGFGCLDEDEVVLIGKPIKAIIAQTDPKTVQLPLGDRMVEIVKTESRIMAGDIDWKEFKLPKQMPQVEIRGGSAPRRDQVGSEKLSSGGMPQYIKNPTARLIAGLGKTEAIKSIDADMRTPTSDLDIAKTEGRPISWLLNETIDPDLGQIMGELVDDLLGDKNFRTYFEDHGINPYYLGYTVTESGVMAASSPSGRIAARGSDHQRSFMIAMIKMNSVLQDKYPELISAGGSQDTVDAIAIGLAQRAGIIAMRSMWIEREAKLLNMRVDELIDKMIDQTRRLHDYNLQLNDGDSELDPLLGHIRSGVAAIDRVVVAVDDRAIYALANSPKENQRLLSQFEARRSNGAYDISGRAQQEVAMFGYHPEMEPSKRPIYGVAAYGGISELLPDSISQYGEYLVVLKPSVNDRTTVSEEDSLSQMATASSMKAPGLGMRAMIDGYGSNERSLLDLDDRGGYIEAHVHSINGKNGVSLDDIEYILITSEAAENFTIDDEQEIEKLQEKLGIPFRYMADELDVGLRSDYDGLIYVDDSDLQ